MADELRRVSRGGAVSSDTQMATRVLTGGAAAVEAYTGTQTSVLQPAGAGTPPRDQATGPRRSALPWVLVFILLLVSAAVGYVVYQQLGGSGVTVPTLTGNCDHAKAQLTAVGLKGVCKDRESSAAKQGQVVASDPSFGSSADKNSTVTVFIGAGPNTITVPDVHGKSLQDAQAILQGKGFQVDTTTIPVNSAKVNAGDVVGTIPKAGEQEPRGTVIQIQVATGNVVVPDVKGLSCDDATAKLKQKTLVATCQDQPSDQPQGQAFDSSPAAGTLAPQNSSVAVLVSSGPQKVSVPPVTNIDKNDAMHMLHDAGLKAAITQQVECTDPAQNNIVQSQDPAAGAQVPQGSTVTIVVLKFKPTDPSCVSPPPT
jgi:serine/threonine-protein kinase